MKDFCNLTVEPNGLAGPTCFLWTRRLDLTPRCDCWTKRPRWTVIRILPRLFRCVDCGKFHWAKVGVP
jgi:hypothetical protein